VRWRHGAARGVRRGGILLSCGVILTDRGAVRPRLLWDICWSGDVRVADVRRRLHLEQREILPCRINYRRGRHLPGRLRMLINELYCQLYAGRILVSRWQHLHGRDAVQRGVLWGLAVLHGRHVRGPLPLRTWLLLPRGLRNCQWHAVSRWLVLLVDGCRAGAVHGWILLPPGDLQQHAAAVLLGHVRRGHGAPVALVLRHVQRGVLLSTRVHQRHGSAMLRQRRVLPTRSCRAR
jgi:hypothetical protein